MVDTLNKLCKWRSVLAGWHAGTKAMNAAGAPAMRDLMDKWLIARVEGNAIAALLSKKGVFSAEEFTTEVHREAALLDRVLEIQFPGFRTFADGVEIYDLEMAQETMRKLAFPP